MDDGAWKPEPERLRWGCVGVAGDDIIPVHIVTKGGSNHEGGGSSILPGLARGALNVGVVQNTILRVFQDKIKGLVYKQIFSIVENNFKNPFVGFTKDTWASRTIDQAPSSVYKRLKQLSTTEANDLWNKERLDAGPDAWSYNMWQIIQRKRKTFELVINTSGMKEVVAFDHRHLFSLTRTLTLPVI